MKTLMKAIAALIASLVCLAVGGYYWYGNKQLEMMVPPPDQPGASGVAALDQGVDPVAQAPMRGLRQINFDKLASPPGSAGPWTRWWLPGGDIDAEGLSRELAVLKDAGFSGVEIQPFLSGMVALEAPVLDRVYQFDSAAYYEALAGAFKAADALDMQIDLTHFSGWPPGGPEVLLDESLQTLVYADESVSGPRAVEFMLPRPKPGISSTMFAAVEFSGADFVNFPHEHARLASVVAGRIVSGERSSSMSDLTDVVTLDPASLVVLDEQVSEGVLRWDVPEGEWMVVASYLMPSGEVPMGAAQKTQGFVIDHLRKDVVRGHYEYAYGERTGLAEFYGKPLRGIFNDSLEFRVPRLAAFDILDEFAKRRGYDLRPYLPAIYKEGVDNVYFSDIVGVRAAPEFALEGIDERVRFDYQLTLSDLIIERFIDTSRRWAEHRGLVSRGQSYGMDIDILRALGANSIPELEQLYGGGSDLALKFGSSAGALYGRELISSESFVWINRDWTTTARKLRAAADKLFLAGINQVVYHGTPLPWKQDSDVFGPEGWTPFSANGSPAHFSTIAGPMNAALWPDIPDVNRYIAKIQYVLQQGSPVIDVLVYYPFFGFRGANPESNQSEAMLNGYMPDADPDAPSQDPLLIAAQTMLDFTTKQPKHHAEAREQWLDQMLPLLQELDRRGISWGWVNDHAIQSGLLENGELVASGGRYSKILIANAPHIQLGTLAALLPQHDRVVLAGAMPEVQPGLAEGGDELVRDAIAALIESGAVHGSMDTAADLLSSVPSRVSRVSDSDIRQFRKIGRDGAEVFMYANQSAQTQHLDLVVEAASSCSWFDAAEGRLWPVPDDGHDSLQLTGWDSRLLLCGVSLPEDITPGPALSVRAMDASKILEPSASDFTLGDFKTEKPPKDWRREPELRYQQGPGIYRYRFDVAADAVASSCVLDLGLLHGSSKLAVNGREIGRVSTPPFMIDVTGALVEGENWVEIQLTAPLRNYFTGLALEGDERYQHMTRYENQLVAAGVAATPRLLFKEAK